MSILALTSDTLAGTAASGQIEYNGQFYGTDSNAARGQFERLSLSTSVPYTSFTTTTYNDFLNIPAWAKRITVMLVGVSTSATSSSFLIQIGSGTVDTTGYISTGSVINNASTAAASSTAGFLAASSSAASDTISGICSLSTLGSNIWVESGVTKTSTLRNYMTAGDKTLSGTLDRIRITTVAGDTFDAGSINILLEG